MTKEKPKRIELTVQEVEALIERTQQESLIKPDYPLLVAIVRNYFTLDQDSSGTIPHPPTLCKPAFWSSHGESRRACSKAPLQSKNPAHRGRLKRSLPRKSPKGMAETVPPRIRVLRKCVSLIPATKREIGVHSVPRVSFIRFMSQESRCAL